jgi:hypothetical protein
VATLFICRRVVIFGDVPLRVGGHWRRNASSIFVVILEFCCAIESPSEGQAGNSTGEFGNAVLNEVSNMSHVDLVTRWTLDSGLLSSSESCDNGVAEYFHEVTQIGGRTALHPHNI